MMQAIRQLSELKPFFIKWQKYLIGAFLIAVFLVYLNTAAPIQIITGGSMEPALSPGDLVVYKTLPPETVKAGDIIVFKVDPLLQKRYNYPSVLCHRVVAVNGSGPAITFRTTGDNTGDDPFLTHSTSLIGRQLKAFPGLGYVMQLVCTPSGFCWLAGLTVLYLILRFRRQIVVWIKKTRPAVSSVSPVDLKNTQNDIKLKIDDMSGRVASSMNNFSSAMAEYAQNIASHTGAVKSLAEAAKHMESLLSRQEAIMNGDSKNNAEASSSRDLMNQEVNIKPGTAPSGPGNTQRRPFSSTESGANQNHSMPVMGNTTPSAGPEPGIFSSAPISVTPELKNAVSEFILSYKRTHGLNDKEMTPELRVAVWQYIQTFAQSHSLPEPGNYRKAIKTVKIPSENDAFDPGDQDGDHFEYPKVKAI